MQLRPEMLMGLLQCLRRIVEFFPNFSSIFPQFVYSIILILQLANSSNSPTNPPEIRPIVSSLKPDNAIHFLTMSQAAFSAISNPVYFRRKKGKSHTC